jgi:hypothetical protein
MEAEAVDELDARAEELAAMAPGPELRSAAEGLARAIVDRVGRRRAVGVGDATYTVEEVTWPVSKEPDGAGAFPNPIETLGLSRDDASLIDVRSEYFDGNATYPVVGEKMGRWRRFRIGSPGERGYDLHLALDDEIEAFAREASDVVAAFRGYSG